MRVLHVNDAASSTFQLLAQARARGLDWRYLPLAGRPGGVTGAGGAPAWSGARGRAARAVLGATWLGRLALASAGADLLHVHGGTVVRHTGWIPRRYLLHLHGTDARSHQYDPAQTRVVRAGMARAAAVLYSTPDLAEHVLPWRPDAQHFPQPLDLAALPRWAPPEPPSAPLVLFASRWEAVKGLAGQLAVARALRAALPSSVRVAGLDWGPGSGDAAAAGVELLARRPRAQYLELLASASVVVGQSSGMLAASELEAMAIGVPVLAALEPAWYPGDDPPPTLLGRRPAAGAGASGVEEVVTTVRAAVDDPRATSARLAAPAWVGRHHDVRDAVARLEDLYARVVVQGS